MHSYSHAFLIKEGENSCVELCSFHFLQMTIRNVGVVLAPSNSWSLRVTGDEKRDVQHLWKVMNAVNIKAKWMQFACNSDASERSFWDVSMCALVTQRNMPQLPQLSLSMSFIVSAITLAFVSLSTWTTTRTICPSLSTSMSISHQTWCLSVSNCCYKMSLLKYWLCSLIICLLFSACYNG